MKNHTLLLLMGSGLSAFANTSYLSVAFQNNSDSAGSLPSPFVQFLGAASQSGLTSETFSTVNGNVTVGVNAQIDSADLGGGYYDRTGLTNSGAFTYAALYDSFAYNNAAASYASSATTSISMTLSGPGITPLTAYTLTFFSFDPDTGRPNTGTHTATISGVSGTIGTTAVIVWNDNTPPTSNNQYSNSQVFESDASGNLTFLVSDTYVGNVDSRSGVRLNAFILSSAAVPEPGPFTLVAAGLALLAIFGRRVNPGRE